MPLVDLVWDEFCRILDLTIAALILRDCCDPFAHPHGDHIAAWHLIGLERASKAPSRGGGGGGGGRTSFRPVVSQVHGLCAQDCPITTLPFN